ncbi:hypothetical protein RU97_GL001245 [Enterococcus canis]|uniref:HTH cro/C1-type domain-containing protein n=1 Tax=Enterococcus canis TaxID=214095 RepID=A0A1L8RIY1_9ENTE|nr:helix-turn-helix transcriptional regulator [Enterococcus canis]OJG19674.1 hypothetical protein RU97_GL001245 [Enterococcus canis]
MTPYGPLVKKIRISKKYTQKEVYSGITSRSFYSKFEAGKYSIEAYKFKRILENLNISEAEFFFIYNKENKDNKGVTMRDVINYYHAFDLHSVDELLAIYEDNKNSETRSDQLISLTAYVLAWSLRPTIDRGPLNTIKEYFIRIESFSLLELELFITTFFIFFDDQELIEQLLSKAITDIKTLWPLNPDLLDRLAGALYVNMIQLLIVNNHVKKAYLLDTILLPALEPLKISLTTQLYITFFKSFIEKDRKQVMNILDLFKQNDVQSYSLINRIVQSSDFLRVFDLNL